MHVRFSVLSADLDLVNGGGVDIEHEAATARGGVYPPMPGSAKELDNKAMWMETCGKPCSLLVGNHMLVPLIYHLLLHHLIFHRLLLSLLTKFLNYSVSLVTQTVTWILFILLFLNSALQFFDLQLPKSLFYLCQLVSFLINLRTVIMSCSTYLKKCILGKDNLSNYRSTSHLSVLSKTH